MTLRQLLLTGKMDDIKEFFKGTSPTAFLILIITTVYVQTFPEELKTRKSFLDMLDSMQNEKDFSDFNDTCRDVMISLSESKEWAESLNEAKEMIRSC